MKRLRDKLNEEQSGRLYQIIRGSGLSLRDIQKRTGVSLGRLGMLNPQTPSYQPCSDNILLKICKGMNVNPFYVLENSTPKYIDWRRAFKK